jgi:hypothetical protein
MTYHKIDKDSINSITSALDFFSIPPTNVTVSSAKVFEVLTSNPLYSTPYHFKIHSSDNYIDLSKCYLFTEFRIRKKLLGASIDLIADDNVAPIQMIGQTFMKNLKISIMGREIFNSNQLMPYKTYLSHEISHSPNSKRSHLNAAGYYWENQADSLEKNDGFEARKKAFALSKKVQCISKIDSDLFNQPLFLINELEMDIEILPHESKFLLIAPLVNGAEQTTQYELEVTDCRLYIKKVALMDGLVLDIARKIDDRPARYACRKSMLKSFFIGSGRHEYTTNLFMDQIPRRIIIGLVSEPDYTGKFSRSPFNFQHFDVREISIIANGRNYPNALYDLDYENGRYVRAFNDMNEAIGYANSMEGNGISYAQYAKTHCLYIFNMTSSGDDQGGVFDLIKSGTTSVNIKFAKAVPNDGITLVVFGEADSLFMIDRNRTVATDTTI